MSAFADSVHRLSEALDIANEPTSVELGEAEIDALIEVKIAAQAVIDHWES